MERLSALVLRVIGENPGPMTLAGTNTYIVGSGRHRVLIDTSDGNPRYLQRLESCLELDEIERIDTILITFRHWDHIGGTALFRNDGESQSSRNLASWILQTLFR